MKPNTLTREVERNEMFKRRQAQATWDAIQRAVSAGEAAVPAFREFDKRRNEKRHRGDYGAITVGATNNTTRHAPKAKSAFLDYNNIRKDPVQQIANAIGGALGFSISSGLPLPLRASMAVAGAVAMNGAYHTLGAGRIDEAVRDPLGALKHGLDDAVHGNMTLGDAAVLGGGGLVATKGTQYLYKGGKYVYSKVRGNAANAAADAEAGAGEAQESTSVLGRVWNAVSGGVEKAATSVEAAAPEIEAGAETAGEIGVAVL